VALRAALALLILSLSSPASAKFRVTRVLDWQSGLPVSFVGSVEQDPEGFLWVGTSGGTFRYDGSEMVLKLPVGQGLVPGSARAGRFGRYELRVICFSISTHVTDLLASGCSTYLPFP